ncbi:MAG: hypothetical protein M3N08_07185 [Pseudomonadota bacterium]|nr:hypothetical protein [Pseudomonadota bacterium]
MSPHLDTLSAALFKTRTTPRQFVSIVQKLEKAGFDFNGLCSNGDRFWPVGKAAVIHGDKAVKALAAAGYRFDQDALTLNFARTAFHGSVNRAVRLAAQKYDPAIEVPSAANDALGKAWESIAPSFRDCDVGVKPDNNDAAKESTAWAYNFKLATAETVQSVKHPFHEVRSSKPFPLTVRLFVTHQP